MSVRRFYLSSIPRTDTFEASDELARHLQVLRLETGQRLRLFDRGGDQADAIIESRQSDRYTVRVESRFKAAPRRKRLVLIQCLPKGSKQDTNVRMATELGVDTIYLAVSERSVSRPDGPRAAARLKRLERIASEAARQSQRSDSPKLFGPMSLQQAMEQKPREVPGVVFWECSEESLGTIDLPWDALEECWLVVGPEGGLGDSEIQSLRGGGFRVVGLGHTILRVETAVPVTIALVADRMGMFWRGALLKS